MAKVRRIANALLKAWTGLAPAGQAKGKDSAAAAEGRQQSPEEVSDVSGPQRRSVAVRGVIASLQGRRVRLVVGGEASTREEARSEALRSGVSHVLETFARPRAGDAGKVGESRVSLPEKDVQVCRELPCVDLPGGGKSVALQVSIPVGRLLDCVRGAGVVGGLPSLSFAVGMQMKELARRNEAEAFACLMKRLEVIAQTGMFSFALEAGEPRRLDGKAGCYVVPLTVKVLSNHRTRLFYQVYYETLSCLALSETERKEYAEANIPTYIYRILTSGGYYYRYIGYALRNDFDDHALDAGRYVCFLEKKAASSFLVKDNIGTVLRMRELRAADPYRQPATVHVDFRGQQLLMDNYRKGSSFCLSAFGVDCSREVLGDNSHFYHYTDTNPMHLYASVGDGASDILSGRYMEQLSEVVGPDEDDILRQMLPEEGVCVASFAIGVVYDHDEILHLTSFDIGPSEVFVEQVG